MTASESCDCLLSPCRADRLGFSFLLGGPPRPSLPGSPSPPELPDALMVPALVWSAQLRASKSLSIEIRPTVFPCAAERHSAVHVHTAWSKGWLLSPMAPTALSAAYSARHSAIAPAISASSTSSAVALSIIHSASDAPISACSSTSSPPAPALPPEPPAPLSWTT